MDTINAENHPPKELSMLTILLPCYNEETTIAACIEEAGDYLNVSGLDGEILVVDNDSTDRSAGIAKSLGARVVSENVRGYGATLRRGFAEARGDIIIMADADTTYDLGHLDPLVLPLVQGNADMMIGIRQFEKGSMSLSHAVGAKMLSALARWRFHCDVKDFHCGIRGISKAAAQKCTWKCNGMELATEMIGEAVKQGLRIGQVPVPLRECKDKDRVPKLRTIRDGFRHLWLIFGWKRI